MEFYLSFSELFSKFPNTIILVFLPIFIFTILAEALVMRARHGEYSWTNTGVSTLVAVGHLITQAATHGIIFGIKKAGTLLSQHFPRQPDDRNELPDDVAHD